MPSTDPARHRRFVASLAGAAVLLLVTAATAEAHTAEARSRRDPILAGRAVLPVETYAPGPTSGNFLPPGVVNGIEFPLPSQPVEGFSAVDDGRASGWPCRTTASAARPRRRTS